MRHGTSKWRIHVRRIANIVYWFLYGHMQAIGVIATGGFCTSYFHTNSLHMAVS